MHFIVVIAFGLFAVAIAELDKCMRLAHPITHSMPCCKKSSFSKDEKEFLYLKECFHTPLKPPPSCELDICLSRKIGYGTEDGKFNKTALEAEVKRFFEEDLELVEEIKEKCIHGDLSKYGRSDFCDLLKFKKCMHLQMALVCPEWNTEGQCNGIKELVAECTSNLK